ncbi:alpha/beta hydrolase [Aliiglaciecola sp. 3_MG-2023]|uniref:alpha/beta hydrolase n=1 Tax=Aliiglaciecola sp. 3_MG-2023 TaxID=3062644 RepID=UPI0026E33D06|nr:alpha/beta hydrolase [Aliiglaciecola sp. 3_MG-2023]MDO6695265.1 alpha/beta hydrolase [Aliiglaciecola sp. 3_MG-2023]
MLNLKGTSTVFISLLVFLLSACSSNPKLMPTPNVFVNNLYSESEIPEALRETSLELIYVTDRGTSEKKGVIYDASRSSSLAYGVAKVNFADKLLSWEELVEQSTLQKRSADLTYVLEQVDEQGRFPVSPYKFRRVGERLQIDEDILEQKSFHETQLNNNINQRLKNSENKDVILFVHGFNNTFNESVFTLAGIWHFLKRQGVPIVYSWPAAAKGVTAYFADKESGQFTIFHLKETLRLLFKNPEIENIHIIAHSRGTDVVTTTLRELIIENRASGGNPRKDLRIENLILAAPDLDFGIIKQRLMAEQFGPAFGKITIYTSQEDSALGISQWLTNGLSFGRLNTKDVNMNERNIFNSVGNVSLIKVPKSVNFIGHDYFHSNPAVSSDLINLILFNAEPGSKERPLKRLENNFWSLDSDYLIGK